LLWALGFYSDYMYPAVINCRGCPEKNPFHPAKSEKRINRRFDYAMVYPKFPGVTLEASEDQGWAWKELEKVRETEGGASREQLGALVLLMVFIQHGDQKPEQQRLACLPGDLVKGADGKQQCAHPVLMVQDVGATFGRADLSSSEESKWRYDLWSRKPIWNLQAEAEYTRRTGYRACIGDLTSSMSAGKEGIDQPVITEAGRKFLADLLAQLTDQQIRDLFTLGNVDVLKQKVQISPGVEKTVTIEDWVEAFKDKRKQIVERTCAENKPASSTN
jgi:hypothetical protein